jgi:hypothetical protein
MSKRVFTVTVNGRTFKRASENRTYTHAILALRDLERERAVAHGWTKQEEQQAEANFRFHQQQADGSWWKVHGFEYRDDERTREVRARSQGIVDAGLVAFVAASKARKIEQFEQEVAGGAFRWHAIGWAGSAKLAEAEVRRRGGGYYKDVRAVLVAATVVLPE